MSKLVTKDVRAGDLPIGATFKWERRVSLRGAMRIVEYTVIGQAERRGKQFVLVRSDWQGEGTIEANSMIPVVQS